MATGNNNDGGVVRYTGTSTPGKGVSGYIEERTLKNQFSNDVWRDSGYLAEGISQAKQLETIYTNLMNITDKMSKTEQRKSKELLAASKMRLDYLNQIKSNGEISDEEAIAAIKDMNKLRLKGQEEYIKILETAKLTQEELDKNHLVSLQKATNEYDNMKSSIADTEANLKNVSKILKVSTKNLTDSVSETLKGWGDRLSNLSNMFNLQSISNNMANKQLTELNALKTNINQLYGNGKFDSFTGSLNSTLKGMNRSMGNLFNTDDMQQYIQNLSTYGITNTKMAEDSFKSTLISTKYLGATNETITSMFKFMKLTNNTDIINKHNRTVVGLLKSELGVSTDQLDALSDIAYGSADDKLSLGMTSSAVDAQNQALQVASAALTNMYGDNGDTAKAILNAFNDFMSNPGDSKWISTLGSNYTSVYNSAFSGNTLDQQLNAFNQFLDSISSSNLLNLSSSGGGVSTAISKNQLNSITGLNSTVLSSLGNFDNSEYQSNVSKALESINNTTDEIVDQYVEENSVVSSVDKIYNWLSTTFNPMIWKVLPYTANAAFLAYLGSDLLKFGKFGKGLTDFFSGKGKHSASSLVENTLGSSTGATKVLGALSSGAAIVGLTAAAVSGIAAASDAVTSKAQSKYANEASESLNGTELAGNQAAIGAYSTSKAAEHKSGWQKNFGSLGSGWKYITSGIVASKDGSYKNETLLKWMYDNGAISSGVDFLSLAYLMDSIGDLSAYNNAMGTSYTHKDLKQLLDKNVIDKATIDSHVKYYMDKGDYSFYNDDGSRFKTWSLDLNKYAKNGLAYVPRDNYKALLHQGEMVLTADEASAYRQMMNIDKSGKMMNVGGPSGGITPNVGGESDGLLSMIHSPWNRISSMYGSRPNPFGKNGSENHGGMDIAAPQGTPVGAAINGKVFKTTTGYGGGFGNSVYLSGDNGLNYITAHFMRPAEVKEGQTVTAGQLIGYVGSTGRSTGPHLHFQVNKGGWNKATTVDPTPYLNTGVLYPGSGSITGVSTSTTSSSSSTGTTTTPITTSAFIPKSFLPNSGGPADNIPDSTTRITHSVDSGFKNLISYLQSIQEEQNTQRKILNTFANSRLSESNF